MEWIVPALVVLICPLMMVFMMRGGHGHDSHSHGTDDHLGGMSDEQLDQLLRRAEDERAKRSAPQDRQHVS